MLLLRKVILFTVMVALLPSHPEIEVVVNTDAQQV